MLKIDINDAARQIHENNKAHGFEVNWSNVLEKLMLIVTECSEAAEEYRMLRICDYGHGPTPEPGQQELLDKLSFELADIMIRTIDLSVWLDLDLEKAIIAKHEKNVKREYMHGKQR
jgi:NTP pyrophosphatase (non-canonical NTP hydrolase)